MGNRSPEVMAKGQRPQVEALPPPLGGALPAHGGPSDPVHAHRGWTLPLHGPGPALERPTSPLLSRSHVPSSTRQVPASVGALGGKQYPSNTRGCVERAATTKQKPLSVLPSGTRHRAPTHHRAPSQRLQKHSSHVEPDSQPARQPPHRDYNTGPQPLATDGRKRAMNVPLQMGTERKQTSGRGPPQTHPLSPQERPQTVGRDERRPSSGRSLPRRTSTTPSRLRDKTEFLKSSQQSADAGHMFYSGPWW